MTAPSVIEAWAIKAPDGSIVAESFRIARSRAISEFLKTYGGVGAVWFDWESEGYRCVRVRIEEVAE